MHATAVTAVTGALDTLVSVASVAADTDDGVVGQSMRAVGKVMNCIVSS